MLESQEMSRAECEEMLRTGVVGRLAVSTPTGPHIVPVNYSVVDDAIIVRTSPYSLVGTYGRDSVLAFEVDHIDYDQQHGCSVVARGRAEVITDPALQEHIRAHWPPRPWAAGTRQLYLRIAWSDLTGRRLGGGWKLADEATTRRTV